MRGPLAMPCLQTTGSFILVKAATYFPIGTTSLCISCCNTTPHKAEPATETISFFVSQPFQKLKIDKDVRPLIRH